MITLNIGQRTRLQEIHYSPHMVGVCSLVKRSQKHTLMKTPQELIKRMAESIIMWLMFILRKHDKNKNPKTTTDLSLAKSKY